MESSTHLLIRARSGDDAALNELLERYTPRLRRWASGRLPSAARGLLDTEDIVQDTLARAVRHLNTMEIRGEGALQAYLRQALANRLTDAYRRPAPATEDVSPDLPSAEPSPLEQTIGADALRRYDLALGRLSDVDRQAIILRVEMDCDYEEIAAALNKQSMASARMTVSRALARLAIEMTRVG